MFPIIRQERPAGPVARQQRAAGGMEYLTFPKLSATGIVSHLFTTRTGGVSPGIYRSLNLSFTRGDDPGLVLENYRRVGKILGCGPEDMVSAQQTHTTNIRTVTREDRGKGIVRSADYADVDGLITDEPGIALVTLFADCVPLYLVDPARRAVGLAHAGWRGTAAGMGGRMAQELRSRYGSRPEDLLAAIGPAICSACYEVGEDVAEAFVLLERGLAGPLREIRESGLYRRPEECAVISRGKRIGKYQLDLWLANLAVLRGAGIPPENISTADICTCHNPDYLFSHRASGGKRGNLGAFLMLKKN